MSACHGVCANACGVRGFNQTMHTPHSTGDHTDPRVILDTQHTRFTPIPVRADATRTHLQIATRSLLSVRLAPASLSSPETRPPTLDSPLLLNVFVVDTQNRYSCHGESDTVVLSKCRAVITSYIARHHFTSHPRGASGCGDGARRGSNDALEWLRCFAPPPSVRSYSQGSQIVFREVGTRSPLPRDWLRLTG